MDTSPLFLAPVSADADAVESAPVTAARDAANAVAPDYTQLFSEKA